MNPQEKALALFSAIESVRNLRPGAYALAVDSEAELKARWTAFDEIYEAVCEGLRQKEFSPDAVLSVEANYPPGAPPPTPAQLDRARQVQVAVGFLFAKFRNDPAALPHVMMEAEALVPTPPDPDTGRPALSLKDQALLGELTGIMRTAAPEDWECFFKAESEPAAKRKLAFRRMYAAIGKSWMDQSLFPRSLEPEQRQKEVILAFMCHVPADQWGEENLKELEADLLPIEEPDWTDPALFGP